MPPAFVLNKIQGNLLGTLCRVDSGRARAYRPHVRGRSTSSRTESQTGRRLWTIGPCCYFIGGNLARNGLRLWTFRIPQFEEKTGLLPRLANAGWGAPRYIPNLR